MEVKGSALLFFVSWLVLFSVQCQSDKSAFLLREPFYWGAATSAYQVEGGALEGGREPSQWDVFSHIPGKTFNNETGDIAADSYHKILDDVALLSSLGVNSYRFSLSWSRIIPHGTGYVNQAGIQYYNQVLDALESAAIEPFVTLLHWDYPQELETRYGGLLDRQFVFDFREFANVCFAAFGDRVKHWITINEPWTVAFLAYGKGTLAPGRCSDRRRCSAGNSSTESYIAAHNMLLAHAHASQLYRHTYQPIQHGLIGITLNMDWPIPFDPSNAQDVAAAERRREFVFGWFADPLFFGRYPTTMTSLVGSNRLPSFNQTESRMLQRSIDFLGVNHYTTHYFVHRLPGGPTLNPHLSPDIFPDLAGTLQELDREPSWQADQMTMESSLNPDGVLIGPQAASPWLQVVPHGLEDLLHWIHLRYNLYYSPENSTADMNRHMPPWVYITENGCDAPGESQLPRAIALRDSFRINYFEGYLAAMDRAISRGARVKGYFAWSLLDNFEWSDGYDKRFGLFYVDFADPQRTRYAKDSAGWFASYVKSHDNYAGTQRVIVPIHGPGPRPPIHDDDDSSRGVKTATTSYASTSVVNRLLTRFSECSGATAAVDCQWWERIVAGYFAQAVLHARW